MHPRVITVTDNTRSMISFRRRDQAYHVRLHHIFLGADEGILKAIAEYISGKSRRSLRYNKGFYQRAQSQNQAEGPAAARKARITHQGRYFNLLDSFTGLMNRYFGGGIDCSITWGKRIKHSAAGQSGSGAIRHSSDIIRINPVLDREFVPQYVLDSITYHEMLHRFLGIKYVEGRRLSHYPEFKEMERRFIHQDRAKIWIKKNLNSSRGNQM